jgi:GntR family transcriptional regulator
MSLAKPFNTRPLYQQVADEFVSRIITRTWAPGQLIENEAEIARSLGISLGTVRKAFDILTENKLLERHQGRGTIVVDFEGDKMRSRFSNIVDRSGNRVSGEVAIGAVDLVLPKPEVAERLQLTDRTPVLAFERKRTHLGRLFMVEDVFLRVGSQSVAIGVEEMKRLASSRWTGQDIATYKIETVGSALAGDADKRAFRLGGDTALLTLDRVIYSYQSRALELRLARCHLGDDLAYRAD